MIEQDAAGIWWPPGEAHYRGTRVRLADEMLRHVGRGRVVVQAGGHVGLWPRALARVFETVYTCEPDAANFACLTRNVDHTKVIAMRAVLGAAPGCVGLHSTTGRTGLHYIAGVGVVPTVRVDDLGLDALDALVLDVEGYEWFALEGAKDTIAVHRPVILLELLDHGTRFGKGNAAIRAWLDTHGYVGTKLSHTDWRFVHR
jgi:FkbM family methyltransferase